MHVYDTLATILRIVGMLLLNSRRRPLLVSIGDTLAMAHLSLHLRRKSYVVLAWS